MDKDKFVKLGVVGFLAAVGYSAYSTIKKVRALKEQEVIDITPDDNQTDVPQK